MTSSMVKTAANVLVFCCALISLNFDYPFAFPLPFLPLYYVMLASLGLSKVLLASDMHLLRAPV